MIEQPKSYLKILELLYDTEAIPIESQRLIQLNSDYLKDLSKLQGVNSNKKSRFKRFKNKFIRKEPVN